MKSSFPEEVRFKRDRKDEYALTWQGEGDKDRAKEDTPYEGPDGREDRVGDGETHRSRLTVRTTGKSSTR